MRGTWRGWGSGSRTSCTGPGWSRGDRLLLTIPYGLTMAGPFGIKAAELAGVVPVYAGGLGAAEKLDLVERFAVAAIWATPTYLRRLMAVAGERGLRPDRDLPVLKALVISGEPWLTEWAAQLEAFWGVPLFEMYGSTQTTGSTLLTCERGVLPGGDRGVLHNLDHRVHLEVLDPDTFEAVGVGEQGEAVVTDLVNTGFPCIRFRTGDLVTYLGRAACPCGRALTQLRCGAITRADDRMKIRGVNVWPEAFDAVLLGRFGALEYQGEVSVDERRGTEEVRIRVELPAGAPPASRRSPMPSGRTSLGVRLEAVEPQHASALRLQGAALDGLPPHGPRGGRAPRGGWLVTEVQAAVRQVEAAVAELARAAVDVPVAARLAERLAALVAQLEAEVDGDGVAGPALRGRRRRRAHHARPPGEAQRAQHQPHGGGQGGGPDGVADDAVDVIVLTGAGRRSARVATCRRSSSASPATTRWRSTRSRTTCRSRRLRNAPKVVVAAVNGPALAGGLLLVLASDIVIAGRSASFGVPEGLVGLAEPMIPAAMSLAASAMKLKYMALTAKTVGAEDAERWGLITEVVDDDRLATRVDDVIAELRATSPDSRRIYKELINRLAQPSEPAGMYAALRTPEARDRLEGFAADRPADPAS